MMRSTRSIAWLVLVAAVALACVPASSGKDGDVLVRGTCTKASSAKLKLSPENGRIEAEFEVDQNRNGVRWKVSLTQATGASLFFFRGTRVTRAPSGSFELRRLLADRAGSDRITARGTSPSGEVCRATATFRAGA